jgi:hypothetical protein
VEKKIEDLLAVSAEATQFAAAVKGCSNELWTLMPAAMSRARRADGAPAACASRSTRSRAACQGNVMTVGFLSSAWQFGAQEALKAGDCDLYREIRGQARQGRRQRPRRHRPHRRNACARACQSARAKRGNPTAW